MESAMVLVFFGWGLLIKERFSSLGKWFDYWLGLYGIIFTVYISVRYLRAAQTGDVPITVDFDTWLFSFFWWLALLMGWAIRHFIAHRYKQLPEE